MTTIISTGYLLMITGSLPVHDDECDVNVLAILVQEIGHEV